jgi:Ca2+-binding RTX toxin-like protein
LGALTDATWTVDDFDNVAGKTIQVIGTANKDTVSASYDGDSNAAVQLNTQGIEVFDVALANSNTEVRIDMSLVTGMTTINVTDTSDESVEFFNMTAGTTIDVTATDTTNTTVEVVYADDTGTADSQTFIVAAASANDNVALVIDDIETINISSDTANQVDLSLAGVSMTAAAARNTVNFTGTNDIELSATGADVTTINASGMGTGGSIVQTARTASEASTYTGSAGNDTFIMMHANDALNGGAGTGDTLDINMAQAVGTAIIDLSAADQVASFNGGVNSVVQTGFENLDLAGLTLNGAVVTGTSAANTITGSGLVDQIDGGGGADSITSGVGADVVTGGAGIDTFVFSAAAADADTITDFAHGATGDVMDFTTNTLITLDASAA